MAGNIRKHDRFWSGGVITVFFALLSILFLSLFFALIESARYQGARAQAANITDMGNYSLFGEFEQMLLTEYEVFGVDGAYGSEEFSIEKLADRLQTFVLRNTNVKGEGLSQLSFDPWLIRADAAKIKEYALLSDQGGENFYQQALAYMHETAIMTVTGKLMETYNQSKMTEEKREEYQQEKTSMKQDLQDVRSREQSAREEIAQKEAEAAAEGLILETGEPENKPENPLPAVLEVMNMDILEIACRNKPLSEKMIAISEMPSGRKLKKGTMTLKKKYGSLMDDLIFREYLLDHFHDYINQDKETRLIYELEYILCGRQEDRENLRGTVLKLLWLREAMNYLYAVNDPEMNEETTIMAILLTGWMGIPELTAATKHALLLSWSYAESLLDLRTLMDGGKVPLEKTPDTWLLRLDQLARIRELLMEDGKDRNTGLAYRDYLRILLNLQSVSAQKKRGLDLLEMHIRRASGLSNYRVDHCVVAVKDEISWTIPPLFGRVTGALMGLWGQSSTLMTDGGFAYD